MTSSDDRIIGKDTSVPVQVILVYRGLGGNSLQQGTHGPGSSQQISNDSQAGLQHHFLSICQSFTPPGPSEFCRGITIIDRCSGEVPSDPQHDEWLPRINRYDAHILTAIDQRCGATK